MRAAAACVVWLVFVAAAGAPRGTSAYDGEDLRLCRELNYEFHVNETIARRLMVTNGDPRYLDHQLLLRFNEFSAAPGVLQTCTFAWKQLMCSDVFRSQPAQQPCGNLCRRYLQTCFEPAPVACAAAEDECTDYAKLTGMALQQCIAKTGDNEPARAIPSNTSPRVGARDRGGAPRVGGRVVWRGAATRATAGGWLWPLLSAAVVEMICLAQAFL